MAQPYQLIANSTSVLRRADNATIPDDPANRDRQVYETWIADGNTPDPAPPPSRAGVIARSSNALALSQAQQLNAQGRTQEAVAAILEHLEQRA